MTLYRWLVVLTLFAAVSTIGLAPAIGQVATSQQSSNLTSHVQGYGIGTVRLQPTSLRLSIPIKIRADASWDASEKLRETRKKIVERAEEMGAAEPIRAVGYRCSQEISRTVSIRPGTTQSPRYVAQCYVVVDLSLPEMDDHEAIAAVAQSQLEELVSLIPVSKSSRSSSIAYTTLPSGLTSRDLEQPLALFVASVSDEDRKGAYRQALDAAKQQVEAALMALGVTSSTMTVHQQGTSFVSSSRRSHPAETAVFRRRMDEAVGTYAEAVEFTVRLYVNARFSGEE